jgi:hypothetical protein
VGSPALTATMPTSKRVPFPYEAYVGPVKVMLAPMADGNLVSEKTRTLDATAPVDYTYDSADPYKERAFEWHELYGGFGQTTAPKGIPRRYAQAVKADLSIDGLWMKGPKFETHVETINAGAGEVRQFIQALHGGALTVFAICENGVYRRTADGAWTASLTTGTSPALTAGHKPQQAIRFKHRGVSPVDALYLATSASNLWQYNGTVWALAGTTAGPGTGAVQGEARYIERVNDELWVAGDYWVVKVTDDPMVRANYSAVIYVGDQTAKITWLKQLGDSLTIWKEDGVYTVDTSGLDHELFPTLRGKNSAINGRNAAVWIDRVWFTFGSQTFTMDENATLKPDGTEQMLENSSNINGTWSGGAGHNTWFFYELYYNAVVNMTYLVKHGTWVEETSTQATPGVAQFSEAHHGALYDWNNKATSIEVVSGIHTTPNDRLYVGFQDGTCQWAVLPRTSPNPAKDNACEFTGLDSYVDLPLHHSGFRADNKLLHAITAMGPSLSTTEWVEVEYRLDTVSDLAAWTLVSPSAPAFTIPSQRLSFSDDPVANPVFGKLIQVRVHLKKNPDLTMSPANISPIIEGIVIHESIRPSFSREFNLQVKAGTYLPRRDGLVDRRRGSDILDALLQQCAHTGPVNFVLPTGDDISLTIIDYKDSAASLGKRRDHEWLVQLTAIQLGTLSADETEPISGLTYRTLEQYTLGQLESII